MAQQMKTVTAAKTADLTLVIQLDPLAVARGPRVLPRGSVHASARRPGRARAKERWRRQLARDNPTGPLV